MEELKKFAAVFLILADDRSINFYPFSSICPFFLLIDILLIKILRKEQQQLFVRLYPYCRPFAHQTTRSVDVRSVLFCYEFAPMFVV